MPIYVNASGAQLVQEINARVAGVWQPIAHGYVRVSGTWQRFFPVVTLSGETVSSSDIAPGSITASVIARSDGTMDRVQNGITSQIDIATDWCIPNSAASGDFSIRATVNSGSLTSGTTGSWLALSSDRTWSVTRSTVGTSSANITLEISDDGGTTVMASGTYILSAELV